jgi:N6-adenosine-specific RNA methylase IME4
VSAELVHITAARRELEAAMSVEVVRDVRDKAAAIQNYLRTQGATGEVQRKAAQLKLRAERRLGELIPEHVAHGGDRRSSSHRGSLKTLAELGINPNQSSRWQAIAALPEPEFERFLATETEPTTAGALRVAKATAKEQHRDELRSRASETLATDDLAALVASGRRYGTIYADPPWQYQNQGTRSATDDNYVTMTVDAICKLPIGELAADDAHLHLWTTNAFLFEAKRVMEAWGFDYKSVLLWVKPELGIGNYWRVSHEFLLLGVRGSAPFLSHGEQSWIQASRCGHSKKPHAFREAVERVSPGPRLELFAREAVESWTCWGNEVASTLFCRGTVGR